VTACPPRIVIAYCTQCHWLLRAAWMAQELLSTFSADLGEVALAPSPLSLRVRSEGEGDGYR
jgi:selenoprotein W-related protein